MPNPELKIGTLVRVNEGAAAYIKKIGTVEDLSGWDIWKTDADSAQAKERILALYRKIGITRCILITVSGYYDMPLLLDADNRWRTLDTEPVELEVWIEDDQAPVLN